MKLKKRKNLFSFSKNTQSKVEYSCKDCGLPSVNTKPNKEDTDDVIKFALSQIEVANSNNELCVCM